MSYRSLAPGTVLSGRYQLLEPLGESELSYVYAASDRRGQAQVAVKVFDPSVAVRASALSEFQGLARQASGLGVEGIARAYDFGIDANTGLAFCTAERISWASLDRRVLAQGPLCAADLSRALAVLARALDAAHAAGVVHRNLKPENIFISPDNPEWVRITDFGVSALRRGAPEAMGWGGPKGYTAPEGVDAAAASTPAMDLFALGVIAFFALTRGTPFRSLRNAGFDPSSHWSELNQPLYPVSERAQEIGVSLDPGFDAWFARALSIQPHDRFRSGGELAREFSGLADQVSARGGGGPRSIRGIAASIAQPLLFQPEPARAPLAHSNNPPETPAMLASGGAATAVAAGTQTAYTNNSGVDDEHAAGLPAKRSNLLLLIGAILVFATVALAGYSLVSKRSSEDSPAPGASAEAAATSTASFVTPAPSAPDVPRKPDAPAPIASVAAASSPSTSSSPQVKAALPKSAAPGASGKSAIAATKPSPAAAKTSSTVTKPAAKDAKPVAKDAAAKKKKCSTFLGCK